MYCKEVIILILAYAVPLLLAVKIEPRYNYPIRLEDSEYAVPGLAKSLQRALFLSKKLQKGPPIVHEPHAPRSHGQKYIMVVKAADDFENFDTAGHIEESENVTPNEKTEESLHVLLPNPIVNKKQVVSFVLEDPESDAPNEYRLPKQINRHPHAKQNLPEFRPNHGDDDLISYQLREIHEPKAYKLRKERPYRTEKRASSARIKPFPGQKGRTTIVKYTASPEGGFRIEEV